MRKRRNPIALLLAAVLLLLGCLPAFAQGNFTLGDLNQNGKVDAGDALLILKHRVSKIQLTNDRLLAAEVSGDGVVDAADALYLLQYAVGNFTRFPAQPEPLPATPEEPVASPTDPEKPFDSPVEPEESQPEQPNNLKKVAINYTNFPDYYFNFYVEVMFDTDQNGYLSDHEIQQVTTLYLATNGIQLLDEALSAKASVVKLESLKGIEHFPYLKRLSCGGNELTELDVSKNTMLEYLSCDTNQLTSLDLSKNVALKQLECYDNQLTELNLQNNIYLEVVFCHYNLLPSLDVSHNQNLNSLMCSNNKITSLDLSNNPMLKFFDCDDSVTLTGWPKGTN